MQYTKQCFSDNQTTKKLPIYAILKIVTALRSKYSKTGLKQPLKKRPKNGFQDRLLLNAGQKYCFRPALTYHLSFKTFVLSIFEWPLKTGFNVQHMIKRSDVDWHWRYMAAKFDVFVVGDHDKHPKLYWLPKLHKIPFTCSMFYCHF